MKPWGRRGSVRAALQPRITRAGKHDGRDEQERVRAPAGRLVRSAQTAKAPPSHNEHAVVMAANSSVSARQYRIAGS